MKEINHIQKYKGLALPKKIEIEKKKTQTREMNI